MSGKSRVSMVFKEKPSMAFRVRIMALCTRGELHYMWSSDKTELVLWLTSEEMDRVLPRITRMQKG